MLHNGRVAFPIVVDNFGPAPPNSVFFLTHFHRDHVCGLSDQWCRGSIYCSRVTRGLLLRDFPGLCERVVALPMEEAKMITYKPPPDHRSPAKKMRKARQMHSFNVTLLPSMHITGSAMFLFEGSFGKILHTGDFRYEKGLLGRSAGWTRLTSPACVLDQ
eukprot:g45672.t1